MHGAANNIRHASDADGHFKEDYAEGDGCGDGGGGDGDDFDGGGGGRRRQQIGVCCKYGTVCALCACLLCQQCVGLLSVRKRTHIDYRRHAHIDTACQ